MQELDGRIGRGAPDPADGVLHVWIADLNTSAEPYWWRLSEEERARASRFRFQHLRRRFTVAHGFLRDVLEAYTGVSPEFTVDEYGKPELAGHTGLHFNLSHSGEIAALAIIRGRRVGIDVELHRPIPECASIAARYFTARERAFIGSSERGFFTCWTRKEAYIKAVGRGLSIPLASFDSSIPIPGWWLADLPPIPDGSGAIAVEGEAPPLCNFRRWAGNNDQQHFLSK